MQQKNGAASVAPLFCKKPQENFLDLQDHAPQSLHPQRRRRVNRQLDPTPTYALVTVQVSACSQFAYHDSILRMHDIIYCIFDTI